jgi:hypothetical protein
MYNLILPSYSKKSFYPLSWYLLILLVLMICLGFRQTAGRADEPPAEQRSGNHQTPSKKPQGMSEVFKGTVLEVIDAGRHIYVRIDTGKQRVWVAVPSFNGKPGDKVLVPPGVPVADFQSKKLNRRFKMIYFVGGIRRADKKKPD